MTKLNRIAGAAAVFAAALMAATIPLKSASADNDNWGRHSQWNNNNNWGSGGSFYFNTGPGYYAPAPTYYYPQTYYPPAYYSPPAYYYPAPSYGPSFGFSVRVR